MIKRVDIITLFPEMFEGPFNHSIVGRALRSNLVEIKLHQLRDYVDETTKTVDGPPFGGGPGMVLKAQPLFSSVTALKKRCQELNLKPLVVLTSLDGDRFDQKVAQRFSKEDAIILVCGHYEGIDERFIQSMVDFKVSVGDFVLTGGEIPSMMVTDAVVRLLPGALGNPLSATRDSFTSSSIDLAPPVYTRPAVFEGLEVPGVLLSGDHKKVEKWQKEMAKLRKPNL